MAGRTDQRCCCGKRSCGVLQLLTKHGSGFCLRARRLTVEPPGALQQPSQSQQLRAQLCLSCGPRLAMASGRPADALRAYAMLVWLPTEHSTHALWHRQLQLAGNRLLPAAAARSWERLSCGGMTERETTRLGNRCQNLREGARVRRVRLVRAGAKPGPWSMPSELLHTSKAHNWLALRLQRQGSARHQVSRCNLNVGELQC